MTLDELIEALEDAKLEIGSGDVEVRLVSNDRWPWELELKGVETADISEEGCDVCEGTGRLNDGEECDVCKGTGMIPVAGVDPETWVVYLTEGRQIGYLNSAASEALGLSRDR